MMPLTDAMVRSFKATPKPVKVSDGGGLHLLVQPRGSKIWRLAYRFDGRQKTLSLGIYPSVSLAEAREKRANAKKHLAAGHDPSVIMRLQKISRRDELANTFGQIADEFLRKVERDGRADITLTKKRWLIDLARSDLGDRPIREIIAVEIMVPLRRVEARGNFETARRLRATIGQVFRYAIATAKADYDPTFGLRGALTTPVVKHRAALTDEVNFSRLLKAIWAYSGSPVTRTALQLMAILYPRPGELRQATWKEFDLNRAIWTIPASRAKMRREHRKPLPAAATELLIELNQITGHGALTFPSTQSAQRPLSENTLNKAIRLMGFGKDDMTAHGFRATASTLLNESGRWLPDAIEAELAHIGTDNVRSAYNRTPYWEERIRMAAWWSERVAEMQRPK